MSVEIHLRYDGNLRCTAVHGPSQQTLRTDAPVDNGGKGEAFSPTDLVATALGTCLLTIMGLVAQRHGWHLAGTTIRVIKEMTASPVRRIATLKTTITLPRGAGFSEEDRRLLENAAKSCPVKQSLHPAVNVLLDFVYP